MKTGNNLPPGGFDTVGVGSPPLAGMRSTVEAGAGVKGMPSAPHVPPYGEGALASDVVTRLTRSTRFNCPSAKNPIDPLSGDQNGCDAPSVCVSGSARSASSERTHNCVPAGPDPT